ncbi:hypothetical protein JXQ31_20170 [candidate division KSB1 bacterium]|nr:hypothetical protein [candidate division KSB1 bacterium]
MKPNRPVYIGDTVYKPGKPDIGGEYFEIENEVFYKISNYDKMPSFFMTLVSDSDHWMFISSNGGLTAGRKNPENALFPYNTDDKVHDSKDTTGSKTIVFVEQEEKAFLWEPFSNKYDGVYPIQRNIYKNIAGNKLIFEEENFDLNVTFQYAWLNSEKFGFIKRSRILNTGGQTVQINILDGVQNILPYGVDRMMQTQFSTLVDAYKKNELQAESGLGLFSLSSIPVDKAEPSEALRVTTVWCAGLKDSKKLISTAQLEKFRLEREITQETDKRAVRGAYFAQTEFQLSSGSENEWQFVLEVNQDAGEVAALSGLLKNGAKLPDMLKQDVERGTENLVKIVGFADGLQVTEDRLTTSRHFSNVLFNVMRGGIFDNNYTIGKADFMDFITKANADILKKHKSFFSNLSETFVYSELISGARKQNDPNVERLCYEYLPLTFSRRHGDPSRPWNIFSIETKKEDGSKILNYQGNWRDIFQNWDALCLSNPGYIESIICKFVNASTPDGYNPYRVTRDGFDWEVLDPSDPWSNIGYWGDHQIIYLLKFLELSGQYHPGILYEFLIRDIFTYADLPYRIKPYAEILKNPRDTIVYDTAAAREIEKRVETVGGDGKLVRDRKGHIYHVNLTEKLLIPVLAKLTNFIPEAGIWMNTQRPEWNDANNALVGNGVSMVTLYYMRRFQTYCLGLFKKSGLEYVELSEEAAELLYSITDIFKQYKKILIKAVSNRDRKTVSGKLGQAGNSYRQKIYANGFSGQRKQVPVSALVEFCEISLEFIDSTIRANKRADRLYHAYNLLKLNNDEMSIRYLYEMLEGQVAVLSSGYLSVGESLEVLDALRKSALFRKDQYSYILYPDRQLPRFVDKNIIPVEKLRQSGLLKKMLEDNNKTIVYKDIDGQFHFNGAFRNAAVLADVLERLKFGEYAVLANRDYQLILDIYEDIFDHQSFTGRSGTFFKYEGLGSIYWHMVSKLLLAVKDNIFATVKAGADESVIRELKKHYYEIRAGIGVHKSPELYGAFPTDPYSHTPGFAGAQQPGLTGQVKEDIISRMGELGIVVEDGTISFQPVLLQKEEFLKTKKIFIYYDFSGVKRRIDLPENSLVFTFCQVPVVYHLKAGNRITLTNNNGANTEITGLTLDQQTSASIFDKTGSITRIDVLIIPEL